MIRFGMAVFVCGLKAEYYAARSILELFNDEFA